MGGPTQNLDKYVFPAVLGVFLTLYVTGLAVGAEPELALARAAGGGVLLAVLGRVAQGIIAAAPATPARAAADTRGRRLDVAIDDEAPEAAEPMA